MTPRVTPRFRGQTASARSQDLAGALIAGAIASIGVAGIIGPYITLAFFAVGAGAGYSLSGSV